MSASDDPETVLRADERLSPLVDEYGPFEVDPAENGFRRLVVSVVNQSVSTAAAEQVRERLFALPAFGEGVTPAAVLAADREALVEAGLGERKADTVRRAARAWRAGEIDRERLSDLPDDEVRERITAVRGLGPWTADMYLLFVLGRPDVFPVGDLAVRRAMADLYGVDDDRGAMRERAEQWRPYRSHATLCLWAFYEDE